MSSRCYGWKPDVPDIRDFLYKATKPIDPKSLPESVDLRLQCPPVYDQGSLGSCSSNALGAAYQFNELKQKKSSVLPSRLFIYYNERSMERSIPIDAGAHLRDGIKTMATQGVAPESLWPYDIRKFALKPPTNAYNVAVKSKISSYQRLDNTNLLQLKSCLTEGYPFVFGFTVYNYFESEEMAKLGLLNMPSKAEKVQGGHAVMAVGFSNEKQAFIVRNSWGSQWGLQGYFYMPYTYITNLSLADDFWTIRF